jgi:adenylate cyclase
MSPSQVRALYFTNLWALLLMPFYLMYAIAGLFLAGPWIAITSLLMVVHSAEVIRLNRRRKYTLARVVFFLTPPAYILFASWYLSFDSYALVYLFASIVATFLVFPVGEGRLLTVAIFYMSVLYTIGCKVLIELPPGIVVSVEQLKYFRISSVMGTIATLVLFGFSFRYAVSAAEDGAAEERQKAGDILAGILPGDVASRLKDSSWIVADQFDEATVMIADIAGFVKMTAGLEPGRVVEFLNRVFSVFDRVAYRNGLEKFKAMGDAYMIVAGVPSKRKDHAEAVAATALEFLHELGSVRAPDSSGIRLHIGIATGPVIAGVIGMKRFAYDVWGEAVGAAIELESECAAGHILVNAAFRDKVSGGGYRFERYEGNGRGKGKGADLFRMLP